MMKCKISFKIQPKASKTEITGMYSDAVKIRIQAVPAKGEANKVLIDFLSEKLQVPKQSIKIVTGHTNKFKTLEFDGLKRQDVFRRLDVKI